MRQRPHTVAVKLSGFFAAAAALAFSFAHAAAENQNGEFVVAFKIASKSDIPKPFKPLCAGADAPYFILGEIAPKNPRGGNCMVEIKFKSAREDEIKCKLGWISTGRKFAIPLKSPCQPLSADWQYEVFVLMRK